MDPKGSTDDDFETFRDDAAFRALVGLDGERATRSTR
jgi:hypothetical protein